MAEAAAPAQRQPLRARRLLRPFDFHLAGAELHDSVVRDVLLLPKRSDERLRRLKTPPGG